MGRVMWPWLGKEGWPQQQRLPYTASTGSARVRGRGWGQAEPGTHSRPTVSRDWDLIAQGLYPRDICSLSYTVPRLTLPLAGGYLLVTPPSLGPSQP